MAKVNIKVSNLKVTREGDVIKASWKIPPAMQDGDRKATWIDPYIYFYRDNVKRTEGEVGMPGAKAKTLDYTGYDFFWVRGQGVISDIEKNYDRKRFHPVAADKTCKQVKVGVVGGNNSGGGPKTWVTYTVKPPRKPTVKWEYSGGDAKLTVETDAGEDECERYDTRIRVAIRKADGKEADLMGWTSTKKTKYERTFDISGYIGNLQSGKHVTVKCWAYARGMAGDNPAQAKAPCVERTVAIPVAATLGAPTCGGKHPTSRVKVPVTPGKWTLAVQLERRHGEDGSWETVDGAVDDGTCKALYDSYGGAAPVPGQRVYYRVKSTRDGYEVYSAAKWAQCLYAEAPKVVCSSKVAIERADPSLTSVKLALTNNDTSQCAGTEVSWSKSKDAWASSEPPSTAELEYTEEHATRTFTIAGLDPETKYYIRARRWMDSNGARVYSGYSTTWSVMTDSAKDAKCFIGTITPVKAGTSAKVMVGWLGLGGQSSSGTEISWSKVAGAWSGSATDPSTYEVDKAGVDGSHTIRLTDLEQGTKYYVRARRYITLDGSKTYGGYSDRYEFTTESTTGDPCGIVSVTPSEDGRGATVVVGFEADGNTGTEISWSEFRNAWQSSEAPSVLQATWDADKTSQSSEWAKTQTAYIRGLEPGKVYYAWARRFREAGGTTTYGDLTKRVGFNTRAATAKNDRCGIVSLTPSSDGKGATLVVGWNEDAANDGTEVSWSSDSGAWQSNEGPSTMQATWADKDSKSADYGATQTVYMRGLEPGTTYYVRARRYEDESGTFSRYSARVSMLTPTATSSLTLKCGLVSLEPGEDGKSAVAVVGWDGDRTGCELSWSDDPNAWESSGQPSTFEFDWADAKSKSKAWSHTSTCRISDLEEGTTYYVRARSYHEDDEKTYSDYTGDRNVTPYSAPASVALNGPSAVAYGEPIELYWSVESDMEQTEWHVHEASKPNVALASGTGSLCRASIPAGRYGDVDSVSLYVDAGCGGGLTKSNEVTVGVARRPSCVLAIAPALTSQPASFEVCTDDPGSRLLCTCRSTGVTMEAPDGSRDQLEGDVVWTGAVAPAWEQTTWERTDARAMAVEARAAARAAYDAAAAAYDAIPEGGEGKEEAELALSNAGAALDAADLLLMSMPSGGAVNRATVSMPASDFFDGGEYELSVQAVEPVAQLASETASSRFSVAWSHQAPDPSGAQVVPNSSDLSVSIRLPEPEDWADGDVFDVYRPTSTGHVLVAEGVDAGSEITDPYAPYGPEPMSYRACTRTPDGDISWAEAEYSLTHGALRFDWDDEHVELPWNLSISDSYAKSYESREHVNGDVNGYYDRAVTMTGRYSTGVEKVTERGVLTMLRRMAEFPGACFCRTARGQAFQCNVDVSEIGEQYATREASVSLDVSAMKLTEQFMAGTEGGEG